MKKTTKTPLKTNGIPLKPWVIRWVCPLLAIIFCLSIYFVAVKVGLGSFETVLRANPFETKIDDFELSDICFAYNHETMVMDTNIILVDCTKDSRTEIAEKLRLIDSAGPRAVGLDILFNDVKDTAGTDILAKTLNRINSAKGNVVLAALFFPEDDSRTIDEPFYQKLSALNNGDRDLRFGYLVKNEVIKTKRLFVPYLLKTSGAADTAFDVAVLRAGFGADSFKALNKYQEKWKIINYHRMKFGNYRYTSLSNIADKNDLLKLRNKIILLGSFEDKGTEDRHYTPLNQHIFGRSLPDMSGVEYHAQILSMMINKDFVTELPFRNFFQVMICYFMMMLFLNIHLHFPHLLHYFLDVVLLAGTFVMLFISSLLLEWLGIKLEPMDFLIPVFACGLLLHLFILAVKPVYINKLINFVNLKRNQKNDT